MSPLDAVALIALRDPGPAFPDFARAHPGYMRAVSLAETGEHGERDDAVSGPGREQVRNAPVSHICIQYRCGSLLLVNRVMVNV